MQTKRRKGWVSFREDRQPGLAITVRKCTTNRRTTAVEIELIYTPKNGEPFVVTMKENVAETTNMMATLLAAVFSASDAVDEARDA